MKIKKTPNGNLTFVADPEDMEMLRYPKAQDSQNTPPVPCRFKVGDSVTFTNDYGAKFENKIITGFAPTVEQGRFVYLDKDAWWFAVTPESLALTTEHLKGRTAPQSDHEQVLLDRIANLPKLHKGAGPAFTLAVVARDAIAAAAGDAAKVDWAQVDRTVIDTAMLTNKQPAERVLEVLQAHSPGTVTPEGLKAAQEAVERVGQGKSVESGKVSNYTNPNEFLLAEYSKYEKNVAEGDPMQFDDWLAGSDLPEIVEARELANIQERQNVNSASWVIKEKGTGRIILETYDRKKVEALNTSRYEAVPIQLHLASLSTNKQAKPSVQNQRDQSSSGPSGP